jgi:carbon-monoxide dehydrogenase small subunit
MVRVQMAENVTVTCVVNGQEYRRDVAPRMLLTDFLRSELGLRGTHVGCEQGACGACTILVDGRLARACLMFAVQADGGRITTIEGISAPGERLSRVQRALHENHGLQCGFCTPGIVMTATAMVQEMERPSAEQWREALSGNYCRCTGYDSIVRSLVAASSSPEGSPSDRAEEGRCDDGQRHSS